MPTGVGETGCVEKRENNERRGKCAAARGLARTVRRGPLSNLHKYWGGDFGKVTKFLLIT